MQSVAFRKILEILEFLESRNCRTIIDHMKEKSLIWLKHGADMNRNTSPNRAPIS